MGRSRNDTPSSANSHSPPTTSTTTTTTLSTTVPPLHRLPPELRTEVIETLDPSVLKKFRLAFLKSKPSLTQTGKEKAHGIYRKVVPKKKSPKLETALHWIGAWTAEKNHNSNRSWVDTALMAMHTSHPTIKGQRSEKNGRSTAGSFVKMLQNGNPESLQIMTITIEQILLRRELDSMFGPERSKEMTSQLEGLEKLIVSPTALPWYKTCFEVGTNKEALEDMIQAASHLGENTSVVIKRFTPDSELASLGGVHIWVRDPIQCEILNPIIESTKCVKHLTYYAGDLESCSSVLLLWPAITQYSIYSVKDGLEKEFDGRDVAEPLTLMDGFAWTLANSLSVQQQDFTRKEVRIFLGDLEESQKDHFLRRSVGRLQRELQEKLEKLPGKTMESFPRIFFDITDITRESSGSGIPIPTSKAIQVAGPV